MNQQQFDTRLHRIKVSIATIVGVARGVKQIGVSEKDRETVANILKEVAASLSCDLDLDPTEIVRIALEMEEAS